MNVEIYNLLYPITTELHKIGWQDMCTARSNILRV